MKIKDDWILMGDNFSFHCEDIMTWNKDELKKLIEYIEAYEPAVRDKDSKDSKVSLGFRFVNAIYDFMTCDGDGKITISSALAESIKAKIMPKADDDYAVLQLQGQDGFVYTLIAMDDESNPVISDKLAEAIKAKIMPKAASNDKS